MALCTLQQALDDEMKLPIFCAALLGLYVTCATADFEHELDAWLEFKLGNMYSAGEGVPKDQKVAATWYRLAAEKGNAEAQFSLGEHYNNGWGVEQDRKEAAKWYRLAAEQGLDIAQSRLEELQANGSPPVVKASGGASVGTTISEATSSSTAKQQSANRGGADATAMQAGYEALGRSLLASVAAAIPAILLFLWINVKGVSASGHQMGRKWLAWLIAPMTLMSGTRLVIHDFDPSHLTQWLIGVLVSGPVAYGLGWSYWTLVHGTAFKSVAHAVTGALKGGPDNRAYQVAWEEIESGNMERGLWARSFAKAAGNQDKARALYLKERAKELAQRTGG